CRHRRTSGLLGDLAHGHVLITHLGKKAACGLQDTPSQFSPRLKLRLFRFSVVLACHGPTSTKRCMCRFAHAPSSSGNSPSSSFNCILCTNCVQCTHLWAV